MSNLLHACLCNLSIAKLHKIARFILPITKSGKCLMNAKQVVLSSTYMW